MMCIYFRDTLATLCLETIPASLKVIDEFIVIMVIFYTWREIKKFKLFSVVCNLDLGVTELGKCHVGLLLICERH